MSTGSIVENRWTEDEIRAHVRQLGKWFHNLHLGGVETAPDHFLGDYPAFKWRILEQCLPRDLRGRTVLDVGCNAGFYSLEMKKRGADRVVAIDTDEGYLAQGRFAAQVSRLEIDFRQLSVDGVARLSETFDIVLFMGVLYHLRHPLLALDLLHEWVVGDYTGDPTNWWIPNLACAEAMLRSAGFEIVEHPEEEVFLCRRAEMPEWSRQESAELLGRLSRDRGRRR